MKVGVGVAGGALISLRQGDRRSLENADGTYAVDLDVNGSVVPSILADEDKTLADDQTRTATVTIVNASGADIGHRDTLTITVRGSTAVPALPLAGQLLLTVLLVAAAARRAARRGPPVQ